MTTPAGYPAGTYPTVPTASANGGAWNLYDPDFHLGDYVDFDEQSGVAHAYTSPTAQGDDLSAGGTADGNPVPAPGDEDGILAITNPLSAVPPYDAPLSVVSGVANTMTL